MRCRITRSQTRKNKQDNLTNNQNITNTTITNITNNNQSNQSNNNNQNNNNNNILSEKKQESLKPVSKSTLVDIISGKGSVNATKRLLKEFEQLTRLNSQELGIEGGPEDDNFYRWKVKFFNFGDDTPLGRDLKVHKQLYGFDYIELEVIFPSDFPWSPPFIRVVRPRFAFHTGHVTVGGSICMELLTKSGWQPTHRMENVLVWIRSEMIAGGARLEGTNRVYTEEEAREAFHRVARQHGWE